MAASQPDALQKIQNEPVTDEESPNGIHEPTPNIVGDTSSEQGLDPVTQSSIPPAVASYEEGEKDKDKGSLSTTVTGTQAHAPGRTSRRKGNKSFNSEAALTASSAGDRTVTVAIPTSTKQKAASSTTRSRPSFISKLVRKLVPCVGPSNAHPLDLDDSASKHSEPGSSLTHKEKQAGAKESEQDAPRATQEPRAETLPEDPSSDAPPSAPLSVPPLAIVPPSVSSTTQTHADGEIILPPTPTKHLLPQEETEGVTSGAVQPPGSTGEEHLDHSRTHHPHDSGDESDGTSFTEDEEADDTNAMEDVEDEEDRLIMNGGAGIPIGPDGVPRPLLPPIAPQHVGRKCLVLDLDETLVHSSFKSIQQADYVVPVEIEYHWHNVYVIKRPGVDNFLKKMGEIYEVVVFTASLSKYADPVLDKLDIHQVVSHRLFRESCYNHKGNYVKDLSQLGRPIADTIILDNSPASYIFHPNNAVPVSSWFNDPHDTELTDLCPFLADLAVVDDVRGVLDGGL